MPASVSAKIKHLWKRSKVFNVSLKDYARSLLTGENEEDKSAANDWFANKNEEPQKKAKDERFKTKGPMLAIIRQATKNAKKS